MRCDEFRAAYLQGDLDATHEDHLASCALCRAEVEHLDDLRPALSSPALWNEPSADMADRVVAAVVGTARPAAPNRPERRRRLFAVVAAAAVFAVVVAGVAVVRHNPPDWEIAMAGTELAPHAGGTIQGWNTEAGSQLIVDVDGLAPAPDGSVYELWMSADGRLVSAGTFVASHDVRLGVGVSRSDFPDLRITLESIDGDPSPSNDIVLVETRAATEA